MGHSHDHSHSSETSGTRLFITILLNFTITIAEIIGGIISGSLSLISDAMHNFSDGIAVIISYIAIRLNKKPKDYRFTFGYKRAEILAAVFNASVLIGISLYLFFEAYNRFVNPEPIKGSIMIIVASVGLAANIAGTLLLKSGAKENMNIRSAYLHLFSDAISSVGVIIGGVFIYYYKIYWIDPVITVLISLYIIKESWEIVKEAIRILMMGAPDEVSLDKIEVEIDKIDGIESIHHVHLWKVNEKDIHFEAHVKVEDMTVSKTELLLEEVEKSLHDKFDINHVTLQFECNRCDVEELVSEN
ncbi:Cobalt-zinc-cadmium resistance protein CzcD [hydrothermal vent metagenome]|uniref:Cobalt-zinc-cadmium resistance protein CzcD n=1 Tax=hydrothermal vent metagenome TaxID=652676 RepID=A0A3B1CNK3_9ZZZZ